MNSSTSNLVESVPMSGGLWGAIIATSIAVVVAMGYFHIVVKRLERTLGSPNLKEYTFATAFYPDALIIKFGVEQKFRALSSRIKFSHVAWGRMRSHLESTFVDVIYANRRTAGSAISVNPDIIASERSLCVYNGFSICLRPEICDKIGGTDPLTIERFATFIHKYKASRILVNADTDQHRALRKFLTIAVKEKGAGLTEAAADKLAASYIEAIPSDSDLLEKMWEKESKTDDLQGTGEKAVPRIIGFAGGLTERVIAKRTGYAILAPDPTRRSEFSEINSFVYSSPPDRSDDDLPRSLHEVEQLWDDTVTRILNQPDTQSCFRDFLNANIRTQLGADTLSRLGADPVFSEEDLEEFLSDWVSFPRHGRPVIVAVTAVPVVA